MTASYKFFIGLQNTHTHTHTHIYIYIYIYIYISQSIKFDLHTGKPNAWVHTRIYINI